MVSSQFVASKNGEYFENFVGNMVPGLELTRGNIDAKLDDTDIEIKSCQFEVIDNSHNCRSRSGRFMFRDHQHELLKENSGDYIFIVHRNGKPLLFFQAPAAAVNLPQFSGTKSLSWRTLFIQLARRV
ncbi:hypothetical protein MSSIH_3461 [Methanosarcina siciliae HI350]|uniref:Uncharacterized protein n=1 Tax=Methanosarcina siciliae HI350 TaxID=1434119 RepID=A0A0E3LBP9_9EURY|nr:hypothetical protein [Methanosarcina siciliae]AKB34151.1 hypothetical protein MSSIH_3461 [Methanosarcina siciliae HI350]